MIGSKLLHYGCRSISKSKFRNILIWLRKSKSKFQSQNILVQISKYFKLEVEVFQIRSSKLKKTVNEGLAWLGDATLREATEGLRTKVARWPILEGQNKKFIARNIFCPLKTIASKYIFIRLIGHFVVKFRSNFIFSQFFFQKIEIIKCRKIVIRPI